MQSIVGDQVARVALAVLVFHSSHSAAWTAAAYAVTFLPGLAGAVTGRLADLASRRDVMVTCDLVRAGLLAVAALSGTPPWAVCALVAGSVVVSGPFQAASTAVIADLFDGDPYRRAVGLRQSAGQLAQLAGFALGGVIVAASGARAGLWVDAATFAVSAAALQVGLPRSAATARSTVDRSVIHGLRLVARDRSQRRRLLLIGLVGFWIVPEGLAAPYAAHVGSGAVGVGVLLSALPLGFAVNSWVLTRYVGSHRATRLEIPLAICAGVPLIPCVLAPPIAVAALLWLSCGAATAYLSLTLAAYIAAAPDDRRGQAAGLSSAAGLLAQGVGVVSGGLIASATSPGTAVALAGLAGVCCATTIAARLHTG